MARRDLEKIIGKIEDAKTSVEEVRGLDLPPEETDKRLEEVEDTLTGVTDDLDEFTDQLKKG